MIKMYLMTQKGYDVLNHVVKSGFTRLVSAVVSSTDNSIAKDYYHEISHLCSSNSILFFDRKETCNVDGMYEIAISWRWIINETQNLIVLHDSILPKYRGFSPLVNSLKNGESEIGVTALFATSEYDKGDIICVQKIAVKYPIKIKEAIDLIATCYVRCIEYIFSCLLSDQELHCTKQNDAEATYSLWLNNDDYRIDWNQDSIFLERFVNAVGWPYAGAFTISDGVKVIILDVEVLDDIFIENRSPGKVIFIQNGNPVIVCGKGLLKIQTAMFDGGETALPLKKFRTLFF